MKIDFNDVYIYPDQPTTCPICGMRTEIVLDLFYTKEKTQIHRCPIKKCSYEFIVQHDEGLDNDLSL